MVGKRHRVTLQQAAGQTANQPTWLVFQCVSKKAPVALYRWAPFQSEGVQTAVYGVQKRRPWDWEAASQIQSRVYTFWRYLVDSLVATVDAALPSFLLVSSNRTAAALVSTHLLQESQICCFDLEGLLLYY